MSQDIAFDRRMLEALVCPETRAQLTYDAKANELVSKAAHLAYPIRDGIPVMLVDEGEKWKDTPDEDLPVPPPED